MCGSVCLHVCVMMDPVSSPLLTGPLWLPPEVCRPAALHSAGEELRGAMRLCVCVCLWGSQSMGGVSSSDEGIGSQNKRMGA